MMKTGLRLSRLLHGVSAGLGLASIWLSALSAQAQLTAADVKRYRDVIGDRVEALNVLGGDIGVSGGTYNTDNNADISVSKFGGSGVIGDPKPLGVFGLKYQPIIQGDMGTVEAEKHYRSGPLNGDKTQYDTFAIAFGGGARFWFNEHLSLAPTFMGMYGHTENTYSARNAFSQGNKQAAKDAGLINWDADTWTVLPSAQLGYTVTWKRTVFWLSSGFTYFHTEDFNTSTSNLSIKGDSEMWENKLDVDVPLGVKVFHRELHTGGYFSRKDFHGDLRDGINTDHLYEAHGRVVLDYLGKLWKVKWLGVGYSYLWGSNISGVSFGIDAAFKF